MQIKVATWNINSVRLRLRHVARFLRRWQPDVLCLQETKCRKAEFPSAAFAKLGYSHFACHGQPGCHGVAVLSRLPFEEACSQQFCGKEDARHVAIRLSGRQPLWVHSLYVPAGGDQPDPVLNPKFAHKLAFLDELAQWLPETRKTGIPVVLTGDLNVAPLENDVWSHRQLLKVVSHTPAETRRLNALQAAGSWIDVVRERVPPEQKLYTWWSYRARDWALSDRGRRLDHIWVDPLLAGSCEAIEVVRQARGWTRPSDHVPVIATICL